MSRWRWALLPALLCSVLLVLMRPSGKVVLQDTDTAYLLKIIRSNPDPVSHRAQSAFNWFIGDWPLHNHFYRPISTLSFEMDTRLHGDDGAGYVLTNALIAALCVLALFWFLRELTNKPYLAGTGASLFGLWNLGVNWPEWMIWCPAIVAVVALARSPMLLAVFTGAYVTSILVNPLWGLILSLTILAVAGSKVRVRVSLIILAAGATAFLVEEVSSPSLGGAVIGWIPGRTASIMTLFCLISMAAYARFVRGTSLRSTLGTTPLDPPATRNTQVPMQSSETKLAWLWLGASFVGAALALGSHEQAIMLPGAIVGVAVSMSLQRFQVQWAWVGAFFLLLGGYLLLRYQLLPAGISHYQQQQLRSGGGSIGSLMDYVMPSLLHGWQTFAAGFDPGFGAMFWTTLTPFAAIGSVFSNVAAYVEARRRWIPALTGWALSIIAYLPMAWVKPFPHYDYWPLALRSLFVAALAAAAWESILTAWSPRAIRLPLRRVPAPGSLPHP